MVVVAVCHVEMEAVDPGPAAEVEEGGRFGIAWQLIARDPSVEELGVPRMNLVEVEVEAVIPQCQEGDPVCLGLQQQRFEFQEFVTRQLVFGPCGFHLLPVLPVLLPRASVSVRIHGSMFLALLQPLLRCGIGP